MKQMGTHWRSEMMHDGAIDWVAVKNLWFNSNWTVVSLVRSTVTSWAHRHTALLLSQVSHHTQRALFTSGQVISIEIPWNTPMISLPWAQSHFTHEIVVRPWKQRAHVNLPKNCRKSKTGPKEGIKEKKNWFEETKYGSSMIQCSTCSTGEAW